MTVNIYGQGANPLPYLNPPAWVRPQHLRQLPTVQSSEEKIVGLIAVGPTALGNYLAFTCAGNYTVDWGDGTTENFNSGVQAEHEYDFADADLANTDAQVTITAASGLFTRAGHGYSNGDTVVFYRVVTTTGITESQTYFVINATHNTFQVSTTKGGSAIALANDGSAALSPYKQAIVTITPQGGAQLTSFNIMVKHTLVASITNPYTGWVDLTISMPNCSASGLTISSSSPTVSHGQMIMATIKNTGALTSMAYMFRSASLAYVAISGCYAVTNMSYMFQYCTYLVGYSIQNTAQVTNMDYMFYGAQFTSPSLFDTSGATSTQHMFDGCWLMTSFPTQFDFSKVTNATQMFANCMSLQTLTITSSWGASANLTALVFRCYALQYLSLPNTHTVTAMDSLCEQCSSLISVNLPNTQALLTASYMFNSCWSLRSLSLPTTYNLVDATILVRNCYNLETVSIPNTGKVTSFAQAFSACYSLKQAPILNTASCTNFANMFYQCYALVSVPLYNMSAATNLGSMFYNCYALRTVPAFQIGGASASCTQMFYSCWSLQTVPLLGTSTVTNFSQMFTNCYNLQSVPLFDTSAGTDFSYMFYNCCSLYSVPTLNTSNGTNFNSMFSSSGIIVGPPIDTAKGTNLSSMFAYCYFLQAVPAYSTAAATNVSQMFVSCRQLRAPPPLNLSAVQNATSLLYNTHFAVVPAYNLSATNNSGLASLGNYSATLNLAYGARYTHSIGNNRMGKAALETYFLGLGASTTASQTLTITGNPGVPAAVSKSGLNTTALSKTILMADTSNLTVGMFATNAQIWAGVNMSVDVTTDICTLVGHGLTNGTPVSTNQSGVVTGMTIYTVYYVINATADTFQLSATPGGSALNFGGSNGTVAIKWYSKIASIDPNVSITLDLPAHTTNTNQTISFRNLDVTYALLKYWAITY